MWYSNLHRFHRKCLIEWMTIRMACPICRGSFWTFWDDKVVTTKFYDIGSRFLVILNKSMGICWSVRGSCCGILDAIRRWIVVISRVANTVSAWDMLGARVGAEIMVASMEFRKVKWNYGCITSRRIGSFLLLFLYPWIVDSKNVGQPLESG